MMNNIWAPRSGGAIPPAFAVAKLWKRYLQNVSRRRITEWMYSTHRGIGRPAGTGVIGGG